MKELSSIFSIHIASYAILSNHFHLALYADTEAALQWSDHEVMTRWGPLFPGGLAGLLYAQGDLVAQEERAELEAQVPMWRARLADIRGYRKCLNEFIARRAKAEDHCKGRFWESRFCCQDPAR